MKRLILGSLRFYKRYISPWLGQNCRFYPSCSEYMYTAVERFGVFRGICMGIWRVLRCNPFNRGGHDPVPNRCENK